MRTRQEIEASGTRTDILTLEVLLDIRDMVADFKLAIVPQPAKELIVTKKKMGRPKKIR
jgi:hypothetical protein